MIHEDWKSWGMAIEGAEGSTAKSWTLSQNLAGMLLDMIRDGKSKRYIHDIMRAYFQKYDFDDQIFLFNEFSYEKKTDFDTVHQQFLNCVKQNNILCLC